MTGELRQTIMLAMLMLSAGSMLTMAAAMARAPQPAARWTGVVFDLSVAAYAIKLWNDEAHVLPFAVQLPVMLLSFGAVGWFWLFVRTLFEDCRAIRPILFVPVLAPIVLNTLVAFNHDAWFAGWLMGASSLIRLGLALHILRVVMRSWKGDLVEARRQLRGPFVVIVTLYIVAISGLDLWESFIAPVPMFPFFNAIILAAICLLGSFVFLDARKELFAEEPAATALPVRKADAMRVAAANGNGSAMARTNGHSPANGLDRAAKADLERLQALMATQQVWREEGLTVASLAVKAGMTEAQLRWLISECLGYRNFPSYVNAHRIAAAKARLSDPGEARIAVSTIAYDIGFASLGPFNRAFREETGVSPSEWRRKSLAEPSPISESA